MPESPFVLAREMLGRPHFSRQRSQHEEGELCGGFRENVGSVGEGNFVAVRIGSIDVVKPDGKLRHDFQCASSGGKNLGVDGIAQRSNQTIDSRLDFLDDQLLGRGLRIGIDLDFVASLAKEFDRFTYIAASKNAEFLAHNCLNKDFVKPKCYSTETECLLRLLESVPSSWLSVLSECYSGDSQRRAFASARAFCAAFASAVCNASR